VKNTSKCAPVGNKNAFKHGACGYEIRAMKEILKKLIRNPSQELENELHSMLQREIDNHQDDF